MLCCAKFIYLLAQASCSSTVHTNCSAELRFDPETIFLWHKNKIVAEVYLNTSTNTMRIFYPTIGAKIYSNAIGGGLDMVSYRCFKLFAFENLVQRENILNVIWHCSIISYQRSNTLVQEPDIYGRIKRTDERRKGGLDELNQIRNYFLRTEISINAWFNFWT